MTLRRALRWLLVGLLAGVVVWGVIAGIAGAGSPDRVRQLTSQLRCPVCQGESVADSTSSSARSIDGEVRRQVAGGWTDQQILDFYVARFGPSILIAPPKSGASLVLWVAPIVVLTGGMIAVLGMLPRGRRRSTLRAGTIGLGALATAGLVIAGASSATARPSLSGPVGSVPGTAVRDLSQVTNTEMEAVVAKNPNVIGMRLALAERYLDAGDVAAAVRHTATAIDLPGTDQDYERALRLHGWASALSGAPTAGADYLKAAIALSPTDRDALFFLAKVQFEGLHDPAAAREVLDRLAALPMDAAQRAVVQALSDQVDQALTRGTDP